MGFGGATSAMIASLKHNKRTRKTSFEKLERFLKEDNNKLYFDKKSSKQDLERIRKETQKEQRISFLKNALSFVLVAVILIYVIGFVIF